MPESIDASPGNQDQGRTALLCALLSVFMGLCCLWATLIPNGWDITTLIRMTPNEPMAFVARDYDPKFGFVEDGHYDGVYFYAIALDPVATEFPNRILDFAPYRYGHPGYGWMAALVTFGHEPLVPYVFPLLNLVGLGVGAFMMSKLAAATGASGWFGLAVALSPGLLYATTVDTSEPVGTALMLSALWLWQRNKLVAAGIVMTVMCLVKEPFVLVPVGLAAWEVIRYFRKHRSEDLRERLALLIAVPLPALIWWFYVYAAMGEWPFLSSPEALRLPPLGWNDALARASIWLDLAPFHQLGSISLALLMAVAGFIVFALIASLRVSAPVHTVYLAQMPLVAGLSWLALAFPKDMVRNLSSVLLLGVLALIARRRPLDAAKD